MNVYVVMRIQNYDITVDSVWYSEERALQYCKMKGSEEHMFCYVEGPYEIR